jgi:UDP-2,4-diacetamido-2,4,6-trideoxy-beta-L-altropyranose hydrolase
VDDEVVKSDGRARGMKAVFRVDSSTEMGTGHLMRCLTLADALLERGVRSEYVCRELPGNLIELVVSKGFEVHSLSRPQDSREMHYANPHASWLGVSWEEDAKQTAAILAGTNPCWLIVDHYALDAKWESAVSAYAERLMVIDDLADRDHYCDLLLDQNLGRRAADYSDKVPKQCRTMVGPGYVLLREEFFRLRQKSLNRRQGQLERVLVTLGGADKDNVTSEVIAALEASSLKDNVVIDVVVGGASPHYQAISEQATQSRLNMEVSVNVSDMAQRMANADVAIGAVGGTTWERFCMGLPALLVCLADNQALFLEPLVSTGAARLSRLEHLKVDIGMFINDIQGSPAILDEMSKKASLLVDGEGAARVVDFMLEYENE